MPERYRIPIVEDRTSDRLKDWIWNDRVQSDRSRPSSVADELKFDKLELDKAEVWDLQFLYEHHPRGKQVEFYKEIYDAIDERRKARLRAEKYSIDIDDVFGTH